MKFSAVLILSFALLLPGCAGGTAKIPDRIILIVVDTLRRDHLSCYGSEILTPDIDALAKRGQIFTNAYASYHQTTASMASLFTGRTPSLESGAERAALPWSGLTACGLQRFRGKNGDTGCLPRTLPTLAEAMREAGYWTAGVTSNALLYEPQGFARGFDAWVEVEGKWYGGPKPARFKKYTIPALAPDRNGEAVNAAADRALEKRPGDRFFLYLHYLDAHDYIASDVSYEKGVSDADYWVGRILEHLGEAGLLENAVVVLTSDHGERLGERQVVKGTTSHYGNPSFEQLLRVPLIVSPARFADSSRLVRTEDLFRMLKEIAGIPGESETDLAPGEIYVSEARYQTYRKGHWKSFQNRETGKKILIDLESDPLETTNVAAANPEVLAAHEKRTGELARALGTSAPEDAGFSDLEKDRLKALGYVR